MPKQNEAEQIRHFQGCAIEWTPGQPGQCAACGYRKPLGTVQIAIPGSRQRQVYADRYCQACFNRLHAYQIRTVAGR